MAERPTLSAIPTDLQRPRVTELLERRLEAVRRAPRSARAANIWMTHGQIQFAFAAGWLTEHEAKRFERALTALEEQFAIAIADPAELQPRQAAQRAEASHRQALALGSELTENLHLLLGMCAALADGGELKATTLRARHHLCYVARIVKRVSFGAAHDATPTQGGPSDE
ncbi:DUF222 domain-containing protein [Halotalea alkalilenta]|uniref:DUF222 domain-containing protein n=1 Tax=Halotalea alkalilenta TaxID=376489 RepID=UPI0004861171|nr:DUF222 domain-containing protein [Halotalea alkalilenta]